MFTGIVEEVGEIVDVTPQADAARLRIRGPLVVSDARPGDSIAVNGVCLTVVDPAPDSFAVDVMGETLRRSSLADAATGTPVNLERALAAGARLGGHIVQGHVDGTATVAAIEASEHWTAVRFSTPRAADGGVGIARYIVEKGSIAVDGVSLTVTEVDDDGFAVGLIPTTLAETTLGSREVGATVNLEVDVVAKYVERLLGTGAVPQSAGTESGA
ncbi:riboflavin synthase [Actinomycetospora sp. NBRC 106378]|uniref:riboflavin synthase n=1 Tax=Actinomycetospora sp. NBRC 106378 TaxID=3032208 RepID=UPI0024A60033|nr:riboflavin synthase [Actinomycetospora sp. NBRC 106378]GLZ52281.1 riboflavin synthase subunit alpha [Actinomycetospora sp. NBRC 106378]